MATLKTLFKEVCSLLGVTMVIALCFVTAKYMIDQYHKLYEPVSGVYMLPPEHRDVYATGAEHDAELE